MRLQLYPLDYQSCNFDLVSYAHTMNDIMYEWDPDKPVQLKPGVGLDLPNFVLQNITTNADCTSHTNTGELEKYSWVFEQDGVAHWVQNYICYVDQKSLYIFAVESFLIALHAFELCVFKDWEARESVKRGERLASLRPLLSAVLSPLKQQSLKAHISKASIAIKKLSTTKI